MPRICETRLLCHFITDVYSLSLIMKEWTALTFKVVPNMWVSQYTWIMGGAGPISDTVDYHIVVGADHLKKYCDQTQWTYMYSSMIWKSKSMMTSSNGSIFHVIGPLCGDFPSKRPVTRSSHVFFGLRLNKRLSKQWWGWWCEMPSRSSWRHRDALLVYTCLYHCDLSLQANMFLQIS